MPSRKVLLAVGSPRGERSTSWSLGQFLAERLYNNPRPIYGDPETSWARMISAPGSVLSRMGYMLNRFEKLVSHEERPNFLQPIANYLEMFWKHVKEPYADSNGNLPHVSGFQVALHSGLVFEELYTRTHDEKYSTLRQQMEESALVGKPVDMIDLCWKLDCLVTFNRDKHAEAIQKLVDEIFSHQKEDGTWTMPFEGEVTHHDYHTGTNILVQAPKGPDGAPLYSEFQTFHCLYTLAKAGVSVEDPRIQKTVQWCLSRQWPHGGWQGNADYKNFDTPFRDTQFAIMALSQLYKGPGSEGWTSGFTPPPKDFDASDTGATLAALDQYWDDPGTDTRARIRSVLTHDQPLVRFAACSAVGRLADPEAVPQLVSLLGDPSKMVQRGAAWALRQIGSRRYAGHDEILAALKSSDDRTRWGATRIFNQHFKYLAEKWPLAEQLLTRMQEDPVPSVRMAAAQSLYQWWYWVKSEDSKALIEDTFVTAMGKAEHPWVRRNLIEGFHNMQDENEAYFYNSWVRQVSDELDKKKLTDGHHQIVLNQARRIGAILKNGNDLQRDAILRSYYAFHLRENGGDPATVASVQVPETFVYPEPAERGQNTWLDGYRKYAAYDPLTQGTGVMAGIGNDHSPAVYYEESGPLVSEGFLAVLDEGPTSLQPAVLKAWKHSVGVPADETFSTRLITLAMTAPASVCGEIRGLVKELLPSRITDGEKSRKALIEALRAEDPYGLELGEAILADARNSAMAQAPEMAALLKEKFLATDLADTRLSAWMGMLLHAKCLHADAEIAERFAQVTRKGAPDNQKKAVRVLIQAPSILSAAETREHFDAGVAEAPADRMMTLLEAVSSIDYDKVGDEAGVSLALGVVTTGLRHADQGVRGKAIEGVRTITKIQNNPAVQALIRDLGNDADPMVQQSATALLASFDSRVTLAKQDVTQLLDYRFFVEQVQPVFEREGGDNATCVKCHSNHSVFRLNKPGDDGKLTEAQLRQNYLAALKVVDPASPESSLILIKPTKGFEGIELPGSYRKTHGGNVRWPEKKESDAYRTLLRWIQGARVESSTAVILASQTSPAPSSGPAPHTPAEPEAKATSEATSQVKAEAPPAGEEKVELVDGLPTCPVMVGEVVNFALSVASDQGPVYVCCQSCQKKLKDNPAKYANGIANQRAQLALLPKVQVLCPISREPVDPAVTLDYKGEKVAFCCGGCLEKFRKEPETYSAALAGCYTYQTLCPVSGKPIKPTAFVAVDETTRVYFCCDGCKKAFLEKPTEYADKLESMGLKIQMDKITAVAKGGS